MIFPGVKADAFLPLSVCQQQDTDVRSAFALLELSNQELRCAATLLCPKTFLTCIL